MRLQTLSERSRFRASRGGHAPGHFRELLVDCIEKSGDCWYNHLAQTESAYFHEAEMQGLWESMGAKHRARWLTGQLWKCTDILDEFCCSTLDLQRGSTMATAVRLLRTEI
jgi:hypothetical protein